MEGVAFFEEEEFNESSVSFLVTEEFGLDSSAFLSSSFLHSDSQ